MFCSVPDFCKDAVNVYRTKKYIVKQDISVGERITGKLLFSVTTCSTKGLKVVINNMSKSLQTERISTVNAYHLQATPVDTKSNKSEKCFL